MKRFPPILFAVVIALDGCAVQPTTSDDVKVSDGALNCNGPAQCDLYWKRAYAWIDKHSSAKIVRSDEHIILSASGSSIYRYTVAVRKAGGYGADRIKFYSACGSVLVCHESAETFAAEFRRYDTAAPGPSW